MHRGIFTSGEILTRVLASGYIKLKLEVLDKIGLNAASMPPLFHVKQSLLELPSSRKRF